MGVFCFALRDQSNERTRRGIYSWTVIMRPHESNKRDPKVDLRQDCYFPVSREQHKGRSRSDLRLGRHFFLYESNKREESKGRLTTGALLFATTIATTEYSVSREQHKGRTRRVIYDWATISSSQESNKREEPKGRLTA